MKKFFLKKTIKKSRNVKQKRINKQFHQIIKCINNLAAIGETSISFKEYNIHPDVRHRLHKMGFYIRKVGIDIIIKWK